MEEKFLSSVHKNDIYWVSAKLLLGGWALTLTDFGASH